MSHQIREDNEIRIVENDPIVERRTLLQTIAISGGFCIVALSNPATVIEAAAGTLGVSKLLSLWSDYRAKKKGRKLNLFEAYVVLEIHKIRSQLEFLTALAVIGVAVYVMHFLVKLASLLWKALFSAGVTVFVGALVLFIIALIKAPEVDQNTSASL